MRSLLRNQARTLSHDGASRGGGPLPSFFGKDGRSMPESKLSSYGLHSPSLCADFGLLLHRITSNMSTALTTFVPLLDGPNYQSWSAKMQAYLASVDLWLITTGTVTCPAAAGEEQSRWDISDS